MVVDGNLEFLLFDLLLKILDSPVVDLVFRRLFLLEGSFCFVQGSLVLHDSAQEVVDVVDAFLKPPKAQGAAYFCLRHEVLYPVSQRLDGLFDISPVSIALDCDQYGLLW